MGGFMHIQAGYGLTSKLGAGFGIGSELYLPHSDADIASLPFMLPCNGHLLPGTSLAQWLDTAL